MKKIWTLFLIACTTLSSAGTLLAQVTVEADSIRSMLIQDWERAKAYTLEYIEAMPESGITAKPTPDIRSFAEQMLHISQGTIGLVSNGSGKDRIYDGENLEKNESYHSKQELVPIVTASYDYAISAIKEMDVSTFGEIVERGPFKVTRLGWLNKAFEHQTHHRGQCALYLRLQGVTPPRAKLF